MADYPLDPKKEIFIWGPIQMRSFLSFANCFPGMFEDFPKRYPGHSFPRLVILVRGPQLVWLHDFEHLRERASRLFISELLEKQRKEENLDHWRRTLNGLHAIEEKIDKINLLKISDDELRTLWQEFHSVIREFWIYGTIPDLANYGSIEILAAGLAHFVPEKEMQSVMEALTAPEEPSFYQQEEIDLVRANELTHHQKKYRWIQNSYIDAKVAPLEFFTERKAGLPGDLHMQTANRFKEVRRIKKEIANRYSLPQEIVDIADTIVEGIMWQDERKKEIWMYLHHENILIEEICRRFKVSKEMCMLLMPHEVEDVFTQSISAKRLEERSRGMGFTYDEHGKMTWIPADEIDAHWETYLSVKTDDSIKEFKGVVACKGGGTVMGVARIVLDPHDSRGFEQDDILVTSMTTPEYVFLMKKAGAVVTDTGGLTSHAAIVSRELNVPCIVGTKVATSVLKNGDRVEVDPDRGIIRKL